MCRLKHEYNWENHFKLSKEMFEYLETEELTGKSEKVEAISRSIIHLAYYSFFNITKINNIKYGQKNQNVGKDAHNHDLRQIIKYKGTGSSYDDLADLQADLISLKDYRVEADYKADVKLDYYEVKKIFILASQIYDRLSML